MLLPLHLRWAASPLCTGNGEPSGVLDSEQWRAALAADITALAPTLTALVWAHPTAHILLECGKDAACLTARTHKANKR